MLYRCPVTPTNPPLIDIQALGLPVLAHSDSDLVLLKPAGMATELTTDHRRTALIARVRAACDPSIKPRLVHRLDRVTRGVMVVALTREAAAFHAEQIREGLWDKYYLARIPRPTPATNPLHQGLIARHKAFLKEDDHRSRIVRAGGRPSLLEILAVEPAPNRPDQAHALIRLYTGRLHQIRVMLAGLGLPLIGDRFYAGAEGDIYLEHIALWHIDYTSRDLRLEHLTSDPEREPLDPAMRQRIALLTKPGLRRI